MTARWPVAGVLLVALVACSGASTPAPAQSAAPAFPPHTFAQLRADAGPAAYSQIGTNPIGVGTCTGDRVVITVPRRATSRQVISALATVYVQHGMADQRNAAVFAYHNDQESRRGPYTAGRLIIDSPCDGTTPRTVEVDVGDAIGQHSTVTLTD